MGPNKPKDKELNNKEMNIMDAMDHLANMAELDVEMQKDWDVSDIKQNLHTFTKLKPEKKEEILLTVKGTFKVIYQYLQYVYQKDKEQLKDVEMQRGIRAIMLLADEAANKLDQYTSLFKHTYKEGKISEIQEYKDLCSFYKDKISKRFQEALVLEEEWKEMWIIEDKNIDVARQGLRDLESVKKDEEYELFYIRQDDGRPFFNRNLLRHIKLVSDFDAILNDTEGDDPLLRIHVVLDKEAREVAKNIRQNVQKELNAFMSNAMQHSKAPIIKDMIKLTMSLMLACNPHNLTEHTMGKVCIRYLSDFHKFLRKVLASGEYRQFINHTVEELDKTSRALLQLIHACAYAFFTRLGRQKEFTEYYDNLLKRAFNGKHLERTKRVDSLAFFNSILDDYDMLMKVLNKYPCGPLFKTLDIFYDRNKEEGFDPIMQGNFPYQLYKLSNALFVSKCLKLPCPTHHIHINKVHMVQEFKAFLRYLARKQVPNKHLLFNLQDRMSWKEHARCRKLERLESRAEFASQLVVVTFAKKSDFYYQIDSYFDENSAKIFMKLLTEQIMSEKECGFYFSLQIDKDILHDFLNKSLSIIHDCFFANRAQLVRKERLDFLEIFYMLLYLKILDIIRPDSFSFTCKDCVDIGATSSAGFLAMIKMMSNHSKWSEKEKKHMLWILNGPVLSVRERLVNYRCLGRILSALSVFAEGFIKNKQKIMKGLETLYTSCLLRDIHCKID